HIIDSLILPKILDVITAGGGAFRIKNITIGQSRKDASYALLEVRADQPALLAEILAQIADHGAVPTALSDAQLQEADIDGAFPEGFYSTTNQRTEVVCGGRGFGVGDEEMDGGIVIERKATAGQGKSIARCIPMTDVRIGMPIVVGHAGVRVFPEERKMERQAFEFMN